MQEVTLLLKNAPGELARASSALSNGGVNIRGLFVYPSDPYAIVRLICDDPASAIEILRASFRVALSEVLEVKIRNRPGELARLAQLLGSDRINIEYSYVAHAQEGRSTVLIVKVDKMDEARVELADAGIEFR